MEVVAVEKTKLIISIFCRFIKHQVVQQIEVMEFGLKHAPVSKVASFPGDLRHPLRLLTQLSLFVDRLL